MRGNPLIGYGLVVGLDGSGDQTTQTPFTVQSVLNMLTQMGVNLPPGTNLQLKNVAAVVVTASLPPLPPGNSYYFVVRAYNATGQLGPASAEISLDLGSPGAPTGVSATSTGARVTLSWESPVQGGAVSQYLVSVGRAPGASDLVASYPVGAARSASGDLGPGRYFARVRAVNSHSAGPESAEISFTVGGPSQPGPASGLAASWAGSTLTLTWNPAYGAAGYVIEVGSGPGLSNLALINVGNTTSVAGAVPPGTYYVRVRAVNGGGHGAPSNEIVVRR